MFFMDVVADTLQVLTTLFVVALGLIVLAALIMFVIDSSQTEDAVRRNYPVIGRFRKLFTELGEFFRQYFFAMDREEMPFNRAQRDWVARASSGKGNTIAFGSTRNLTQIGTPIFVNATFPPLEEHAAKTQPLKIGPYCKEPYMAHSFFNISGMSFGALSKPAVRALSAGAKKAGIWLNTGEGGLSPYHLEGGCDIVFQIGTAKYGVRDLDGALSDDRLREMAAHENVKMFELKLSQGAKPGKGGILPAGKVNSEIASIRGIEKGKASISPNRHADISNADELLDVIGHIREVTGKPVGFKTVMGDYQDMAELLDKVVARGEEFAPDFITIDGGDGGTGAAPMPLMDLVGSPLRESLPRVSDLLYERGLRQRVKLIASGKLINPSDVAWALGLGADFVVSARGFMFSLGCIQAMKCNKNTCPTGITTHDPHLQKGLVPKTKAEKVANYATGIIHEVESLAHSVGATEPRGIRRKHIRVMQATGRSISLARLYPRPDVLPGN